MNLPRSVDSFFSSLKQELTHYERFAGLDEARQGLFDFVEASTAANGCIAASAIGRRLNRSD